MAVIIQYNESAEYQVADRVKYDLRNRPSISSFRRLITLQILGRAIYVHGLPISSARPIIFMRHYLVKIFTMKRILCELRSFAMLWLLVQLHICLGWTLSPLEASFMRLDKMNTHYPIRKRVKSNIELFVEGRRKLSSKVRNIAIVTKFHILVQCQRTWYVKKAPLRSTYKGFQKSAVYGNPGLSVTVLTARDLNYDRSLLNSPI